MWLMKLFFEAEGQGWSERYWLTDASATAAKARAGTIIPARMAALPEAVSLIWAMVSDTNVSRDSYQVMPEDETGRVGSLVGATYVMQRPQDTLLYRYETAAGKWALRHFHGIPDKNIVEGVFVTTLAGDAFVTAIANLIGIVQTNTVLRRVTAVGPPVTEVAEPFTSVGFLRVSSHKVGRPFDQRPGRRRAGA